MKSSYVNTFQNSLWKSGRNGIQTSLQVKRGNKIRQTWLVQRSKVPILPCTYIYLALFLDRLSKCDSKMVLGEERGRERNSLPIPTLYFLYSEKV